MFSKVEGQKKKRRRIAGSAALVVDWTDPGPDWRLAPSRCILSKTTK